MKTIRFTEEQVIKALRDQEFRAKTVAQVCKEMGISQGTLFKNMVGWMLLNPSVYTRWYQRMPD